MPTTEQQLAEALATVRVLVRQRNEFFDMTTRLELRIEQLQSQLAAALEQCQRGQAQESAQASPPASAAP
jgi:hypothetical protein